MTCKSDNVLNVDIKKVWKDKKTIKEMLWAKLKRIPFYTVSIKPKVKVQPVYGFEGDSLTTM